MRRARTGSTLTSAVSWPARATALGGLVLLVSTFVPMGLNRSNNEKAGAQGTPFELTGSGAWSVNNQMAVWRSLMYLGSDSVDLSYIAKGDRDGRQIFARGDADFVVTGRPLTAEDNAELAARKVKVVSAPIAVASMAFLLSGPYPKGLEVYTPDPDPELNGTRVRYEGDLKLPNTTLANIFLDRAIINNWYDPAFVAANRDAVPAGSVFAPVINPTIPVVRSDPSATNYYLQEFARQLAPEEFLQKVAESKLTNFVVSENWPFLSTASRAGSVTTANLVAGGQNPKEGVVPYGGVITATPASEAINQAADFPDTQLFVPAIQNGAGEWVFPNTDSLSKAIDATDEKAVLPALTTNVPGAYPLAWVNRLYAPTSGLSIRTTNAIATLIRVAAVSNSATAKATGEGALPDRMVRESLAAADAIVAGNCTGSGRTIVSAKDGGPNWPKKLPVVAAAVPVCVGPASAATTTSTPSLPTTEVPVTVGGTNQISPDYSDVGGYSSVDSSSVDSFAGDYAGPVGDADVDLPSLGVDVPGAVGTGAAPGTTKTAAALVSAELPMALPDDGRGRLDRLTTMLLGGLLLVGARGLARRPRVAR